LRSAVGHASPVSGGGGWRDAADAMEAYLMSLAVWSRELAVYGSLLGSDVERGRDMEITGSRGTLGRGLRGLLIAGLALLSACVAAPSAVAARVSRCTGTAEAPGILSGQYAGPVFVEGVCKVNSGRAVVRGKLVVTEGSTLLAAYGQNKSRLTVRGLVRVLKGATLVLGCEPEHFRCLDDPDPADPTLSSRGRIFGDLIANEALGVIVHNSRIAGRVRQTGGGGGESCEPTGPFLELGYPVYSDYEDTTIRGNIRVSGLESCWLGLARLHVSGDMRIKENQLADPDAIEILANVIHGNLVCVGNSMVWNSADLTEELYPRRPEPNTVIGQRRGQCVLASPETEGGEPGPGPF
jgi:hypothetical protein